MICDSCHGNGYILAAGEFVIGDRVYRFASDWKPIQTKPCDRCLGQGIIHCYEGEQEQPECKPVETKEVSSDKN